MPERCGRGRWWPYALALLGLLAAIADPAGQPALSPLSQAIQSGDQRLVRALIARPAEVRAADADGTTPLHWAVRADDLALTTALLKAGAKAHVANRYGVSPLSLAAINGNAAIVDLLLARGAQAQAIVSRGQTIL